MADPEKWLTPGQNLNRALDGIVSHAYSTHGAEFQARTPAEFREIAAKTVRAGGIGSELTDPRGQNRFVVGDPKSNAMVIVTPHKPGQSTMFKPRKGIEGFLATQTRSRPLDLQQIRSSPIVAKSAPKPMTSGPPGVAAKSAAPKPAVARPTATPRPATPRSAALTVKPAAQRSAGPAPRPTTPVRTAAPAPRPITPKGPAPRPQTPAPRPPTPRPPGPRR